MLSVKLCCKLIDIIHNGSSGRYVGRLLTLLRDD